ncbi:transposable element Tcb1 transposase [Trichonephila inaurata madagascariensis]|uniref:Transposable element Tcb1 transposase n=1 Tax=Trichonephila inaurata madagascariensis TaxID=2747483 RepID=A0A8X7BXC6_9ARAC|nr:transposable element Tcb1 transposase [Trichonephila inaurata madagascariensis]
MLRRKDERWRIWRETSENKHPAVIARTAQAGDRSIMVWEMLSWHSLGSHVIMKGTLDQYKYASALEDHIHPYMPIVFPQDEWIYQQVNAKCHTAGSVCPGFEGFIVLPLSANLPDLNPIQNLGDHLDQILSHVIMEMRRRQTTEGPKGHLWFGGHHVDNFVHTGKADISKFEVSNSFQANFHHSTH